MKINKLFEIEGKEPFYSNKFNYLIYLKTDCNDNYINILDLNSNKTLKEIKLKDSKINSFSVSSDMKYLVTANLDKTITLLDLEFNKIIKIIKTNYDEIYHIVFSSNDNTFISLGYEETNIKNILNQFEEIGIIKYWNIDSDIEKNLIKIEPPVEMLFSSNSKYLITFNTSAQGDGIIFWDYKTGKFIYRLHDEDEKAVQKVCLSENSEYFVCSRFDKDGGIYTGFGGLYLYKFIVNNDKIKFLNKIQLSDYLINIINMGFNFNSKYLIALESNYYTREKKLKIYDLKNDNNFFEYTTIENLDKITDLIASPHENKFALSRNDNIIEIWELK